MAICNSERESEAALYHCNLKGMAQHLAEIANVSLHAKSDSTNDSTFTKLFDCSNELLGIGEYLVDVAQTLSLSVCMNAPLDTACVSDDDKATKIIQDIVVIKDDPPLMCKVPVSKEVESKAQLGTHSSESNVPKQVETMAKSGAELHACVALNQDNTKLSTTNVSGSVLLICELCGDHFHKISSYWGHLDKHAHTPYMCPKCREVSYFRYRFNTHVKRHDKSVYKCKISGKKFEICTSIYNHRKTHSGVVYKCTKVDTCTYTVQSESHYKEHYKYTHRSTKTVPCSECGHMFQTPSHLYNHRNSCQH